MNPLVRLLIAPSLAVAALCASSAACALDSGDLVVTAVKGEVHVTMLGAERAVRAGSVLELPAAVRTGRSGAIDLAQGATTVSVGPDTLLEFPALEKRGAPVDRIVQPRGNAFYNIGKREGRKLRVETPYLVGVIKGTQFNVAAQDESTTISLFEGRLEVRASDDSAVVDLNAGEIASRKRGDKSISVLKMDGGKAAPTAPRQPAGGTSDGTPPGTPRAAPVDDADSVLADRDANSRPVISNPLTGSGDDVVANGEARVVASVVNAAATLDVSAGGASADVSSSVSAGSGFDAGANAAVSTGAAMDVGADANVMLGAATVDTGASVSVDAGAAAADVGASANAGAGAMDVGANVNVSAGAVDVGASASLDIGGVAADAAVTAGVDAGALTTDVGAGAAIDLGAGANVAVDVGVAADAGPVDVAVNVNDLGIAAVDLGVAVDLGLGDDEDGNNGHGNDDDRSDSSNPGNGSDQKGPETDVGALLDGLLRRRGKK